MTDIRSLERTLLDNLPWNKASIKFLARFLLALYDMWTVNREASASRPAEASPSTSGRDAGKDLQEAHGSGQGSSPKGHIRSSSAWNQSQKL
jgi:hypothetical protein